jgi:hypothetical protein
MIEAIKTANPQKTAFQLDRHKNKAYLYRSITISAVLLTLCGGLWKFFSLLIFTSIWLKVLTLAAVILAILPLAVTLKNTKKFIQLPNGGYSMIRGKLDRIYLMPEDYQKQLEAITLDNKPSTPFEAILMNSKQVYNKFKKLFFEGIEMDAGIAMRAVSELKLVSYGKSGSYFKSLTNLYGSQSRTMIEIQKVSSESLLLGTDKYILKNAYRNFEIFHFAKIENKVGGMNTETDLLDLSQLTVPPSQPLSQLSLQNA